MISMAMRNKLAFWDCKFKAKCSLLGPFMPHNFSSSVRQSFAVILFSWKNKGKKVAKEGRDKRKEGRKLRLDDLHGN